jgi:hypothetical protein
MLLKEVIMSAQTSLKSGGTLIAVAFGCIVAVLSSAAAQERNHKTDLDSATRALGAKSRGEVISCLIERPSQIQRYFVLCDGATELDVDVADCCVPGDHWEAKVKSWDENPNTAVTTAPGPADVPGVPARVYTYDGPPENPGQLRAAIECSYLHGTNLFPAESFLRVTPNQGSCSIEAVGLEDEIGRRP